MEKVIMSPIQLETMIQIWPPISGTVRVPHTEADYKELVAAFEKLRAQISEKPAK